MVAWSRRIWWCLRTAITGTAAATRFHAGVLITPACGLPLRDWVKKLRDWRVYDCLAEFAAGSVAHLKDDLICNAVADERAAFLAVKQPGCVQELELAGDIRLGGAGGGEQFADVLRTVLEFLEQSQAGAVSEGAEDFGEPVEGGSVEFFFGSAFSSCHIRNYVYE